MAEFALSAVAEFVLKTTPGVVVVGSQQNASTRTLKYISAYVNSITTSQGYNTPDTLIMNVFIELEAHFADLHLQFEPNGCLEEDDDFEIDDDPGHLWSIMSNVYRWDHPFVSTDVPAETGDPIDKMRGIALATIAKEIIANGADMVLQRNWFQRCMLISIPGIRYCMSNTRILQLASSGTILMYSDMQLWDMPIPAFNKLCKDTWQQQPKNQTVLEQRLNALDYVISLLPITYVVSDKVMFIDMQDHLNGS